MTKAAIVVLALAFVGLLHALLGLGIRSARGAIAKVFRPLVRHTLQFLLAPYYKRKAIRDLQEQRLKQGLPPLENAHLL